MPKRKAAHIEDAEARPLRRSSRNSIAAAAPATSPTAPPAPAVSKAKNVTYKRQATTINAKVGKGGNKKSSSKPAAVADKPKQESAAGKAKGGNKNSVSELAAGGNEDAKDIKAAKNETPSLPGRTVPKTKTAAGAKKAAAGAKKSSSSAILAPEAASPPQERQYWLMKAEPEPRYENGINVSFSIDDLAACSEPEPWDGIRNYVARNNLRAMSVGDLAFFYHSNCKTPGIVGVMEIVRSASPDESAWDPKSAYFDPKDGPDKKRWSVVHVEFRRKFGERARKALGLQELKRWAGEGGRLGEMQLLKQGRLSVSRVERGEWEFLMGVAEEMEKEEKDEEEG